MQLSTFIDVTYKTAWFMLHKIRIAINHTDNMNQLSGDVQAILAFHYSLLHTQ
ncbi:hypothetical protein M5X00_15905 [Paenibacillus alvei]|uniref:hypothetical protein n=1 Tax=Paenibacillus alvei TaxID=44250 RepID=UPI0003198520|nr:hypothetical protein [Paenibacillus alvei]MCY9755725.1 hypothetical protein [Paenibacillus alvei]